MTSPRILIAAALTLLAGTMVTAYFVTAAPVTATVTTPDQLSKQEVEAIVRDYILENPQLIIESMERYTAETEAAAKAEADAAAEAAIREHFTALISGESGHAFGAGADEAEVIIVEFFDYNCGYCRRATTFIKELEQEDASLRFVLQDLPIINEASRPVSLATLALANTEDYMPMHLAMMEASGLIRKNRMQALAEEAGVDYDRITTALEDEDTYKALEAKLETSMGLAKALDITGTPNFVIASPDGAYVKLVRGLDRDGLRTAIAAAKGA